MNESDICKSLSGLDFGNREVGKFDKIKYKKRDNIYEVSLATGKNREIRRVFNALGFRVTMLHRIKYGDVSLNALKPGKIRYIESDASNLFFISTYVAPLPPSFISASQKAKTILYLTETF